MGHLVCHYVSDLIDLKYRICISIFKLFEFKLNVSFILLLEYSCKAVTVETGRLQCLFLIHMPLYLRFPVTKSFKQFNNWFLFHELDGLITSGHKYLFYGLR